MEILLYYVLKASKYNENPQEKDSFSKLDCSEYFALIYWYVMLVITRVYKYWTMEKLTTSIEIKMDVA